MKADIKVRNDGLLLLGFVAENDAERAVLAMFSHQTRGREIGCMLTSALQFFDRQMYESMLTKSEGS